MLPVGIFLYENSIGFVFSCAGRSKTYSTFSIPARNVPAHISWNQSHFIRLLPAGIEPASPASEAGILSIELWKLIDDTYYFNPRSIVWYRIPLLTRP